MNFLKLKSTLFSLMAIAMVTVFLSSCEKDYTKVSPNENINKITLDQLKMSQEIWNEKFSDKITLLNYEYVKTIENEQDKQYVINSISDEAKIIANGKLSEPESVKVEVLNKNSAKTTITKDNLRKLGKEIIEMSNQVIALNWDKNGEQFTTYCIANKEGIVWDNILGGVVDVEVEVDITEKSEVIGSSKNGENLVNTYVNKSWAEWCFLWAFCTKGRAHSTTKIYWNTNTGIYDATTSDYGKSAQGGAVVAKSTPISVTPQVAKFDIAHALAGPNGSVGLQVGIPKTPLAFTASVSGSRSYVYNYVYSMYPIDYR